MSRGAHDARGADGSIAVLGSAYPFNSRDEASSGDSLELSGRLTERETVSPFFISSWTRTDDPTGPLAIIGPSTRNG